MPSDKPGPVFSAQTPSLRGSLGSATGGGDRRPLTFAVGVGHGEGVVLRPVQEGERGLAVQQS